MRDRPFGATRGWLKRRLPPGASTYGWRLKCWAEVLAAVRGDGPAQQARLLASAAAAPVAAARGLGAWRTPLLLHDTRVRVGGDRFALRARSDDLWHVLPSLEGPVRRALAERLAPGGVFVDAGANIGVLTVLGARRVGPRGTVIAIEMMPDTARCLRENLRLNGLDGVRVVEQALSDVPGQEVRARMPAGFSGHASIVRGDLAEEDTVEVTATTTTLDAVTEGLPRIDVLKVDLEGAEALAFAGGGETLARTRCVIFEARGHGEDAAEAVRRHGFSLHALGRHDMIALR